MPRKSPWSVTNLYRYYSAAGGLLYVGVSIRALERLKQHMANSERSTEVTRVEIEKFPDRAHALAAERVAIKAEKPLWNKVRERKPKLKILANGKYDQSTLLGEFLAKRAMNMSGLAKKAKLSRSALSRIMAGERIPTVATLQALSSVTRIPLSKLASEFKQ